MLALLAAVIWYGWKHSGDLRRPDTHEVVVVNHSGTSVERVRLSAGGEVVVVEALADGAETRRAMRAQGSGPFRVVWATPGRTGETTWSGGNLAEGAVLMRHRFEFNGEGRVVLTSAPKQKS